jgi:DNA-binding CsgD family transcriptional regulator
MMSDAPEGFSDELASAQRIAPSPTGDPSGGMGERTSDRPVEWSVGGERLSWRDLLAVGVIAGDLSPAAIARFAEVHPSLAEAAIAVAVDEEALVDGVVDPVISAQIVRELNPTLKARAHGRLARHLLTQGPTQLISALEHAQAAGGHLPIPEQVSAAERAARMALSINDYESARQLLDYAERIELVPEPKARAERLRDLGTALHGLGRIPEARKALARAFDLAEWANEVSLAADLAVRYAYPVDWYSGDRRASALLDRAERLDLSPQDRTALFAARAGAEMRIPMPGPGSQQLAWVTRAEVAQPLAERALAEADDANDHLRLLTLLAWHTTHRAPEFSAQRHQVSTEALDLAQSLRMIDRMVDAALMLAVDALEGGDRAEFDRALSLAMWVYERDRNPRLGWHVQTVVTTAALLDGDLGRAQEHRLEALRLGESIDAPGWLGADLSMQFQIALCIGDPAELESWITEESHPAIANPIGRISLSWLHARFGDPVLSERLLRRAVHEFDAESSLLQNAVYAAQVACLLDVEDLLETLIERLSPWQSLYAVDANAWWAGGPVALALAELHTARGDTDAMAPLLASAESMARSMGDMRSLRRVEALHERVPAASAAAAVGRPAPMLTEREAMVLQLLVEGRSNRDIAEELAFSLSTIRAEISTVYRKLGVGSRAEATARAIGLGLTR